MRKFFKPIIKIIQQKNLEIQQEIIERSIFRKWLMLARVILKFVHIYEIFIWTMPKKFKSFRQLIEE